MNKSYFSGNASMCDYYENEAGFSINFIPILNYFYVSAEKLCLQKLLVENVMSFVLAMSLNSLNSLPFRCQKSPSNVSVRSIFNYLVVRFCFNFIES